MHIAVEIHPSGTAVVPAHWVDVAGERLALCRPVSVPAHAATGFCAQPLADTSGWRVVDPETGRGVGYGKTRAAAVAEAAERLTRFGASGLQCGRDLALVHQGALA